MGKSRLLDALAAHVESSPVGSLGAPVVLVGASAPLVGDLVPLAPVRQALSALALAQWAEQVDEALLGPMTGVLRVLATGSSSAAQRPVEQGQLFEQIRQGLWALAEQHAVLFVVEDLHWADPSTLALLAYLDRALRVRPANAPLHLLVALSTRLEVSNPVAEFVGELRRGVAEVLDLEPLTADETAVMVAALGRQQTVLADAEVIAARSDGNPFFVEELAAVDGDDIPGAARDLLAGRLRRVSRPAEHLVDTLAVVGRPADDDLLAAIVDLPQDQLTTALRDGINAGVLVADGNTFHFRHALLGELAREKLLPVERRMLHAAVAEGLERAGTGAAREIAFHHEKSGRLLPAARWLWRAAQHAERVPAPVEAADTYDHLLALLERVPEDTVGSELGTTAPDLLVRAADANRLADRNDRRLALLETARSLTVETDTDRHARILCKESETYIDLGRAAEGMAAAAAAVELLQHENTSASLVEALTAAAAAALRADNAEDCVHFAQRAVDAARRHGDPAQLAGALFTRSGAWFLARDMDAALHDSEESLALATSVTHVDGMLRADSRIIGLLPYLGRQSEVVTRARAHLEMAERLGRGNTTASAMTWANLGNALRNLGRWQEVMEVADHLRSRFDPGNPWCAWLPLQMDLIRGDVKTARSALAVALAPALGSDPLVQHDVLCCAAELALLEGDQARAWATVEDALRRFAGTSVEYLNGELLRPGIRAAADAAAHARAADDPEELQAALTHAQHLADLGRSLPLGILAEPLLNTDEDVPRHRAQWDAEWARLHSADTPDIWETAAKRCQETGQDADRTYCLFRAADALARTRSADTRERRDRLTALLREAHRLATVIGSTPLLADITALAAATRVPLTEPDHPTAEPAASERPHGLTAREVDVLRLLADGLTNTQIARKLYISPNTAGVHVSRIFTKLAVTNRTAAARRARELGLLATTERIS